MLTPMNRAGGLPANLELRMAIVGRFAGGQDYLLEIKKTALCGRSLAEREVKIAGTSLFQRISGSKALIEQSTQ